MGTWLDRGLIAVMRSAELAEEGSAPIACDQGSNVRACVSGWQLIAFGFAPQLRATGRIGGLKGKTTTVRALSITISP
jgi:hypothetical protein